MGDVLDFLYVHLKGRRETARARGKMCESGPNRAQIRLAEAGVRLEGARAELVLVQGEMQGLLGRLDAAQKRIDELNDVLQCKRRVLGLLVRLERKERIRERRFQELVRLLDVAREYLSQICQPKPIVVIPPAHADEPSHISLEATRDLLTELQAYHIGLVRLASQRGDRSSIESRLLETIANATHLPISDKRVKDIFDRCMSSAHVHADHAICFASPGYQSGTGTKEIEERLHSKQGHLQYLSDASLELSYCSSQLLSQISSFITDTSRSLSLSLKRESKEVIAYLDVLERAFVSLSLTEGSARLTGVNFGAPLSLTADLSLEGLLSSVASLMLQTHDRERFLARSNIRIPHFPNIDSHLIDAYTDEETQHNEEARSYLSRKVGKSAMCDVLAQDIETLIAQRDLTVLETDEDKR